jgi:hypothetical protein
MESTHSGWLRPYQIGPEEAIRKTLILTHDGWCVEIC